MELLKTRGVKLLTILLMLALIPAFISAETEVAETEVVGAEVVEAEVVETEVVEAEATDALYDMNMSINISSAYYFPDHLGYELEGNFAPITYTDIKKSATERALGSSWGGAELKANFTIDLKRDFLTGGSAMTKDNSLKHSFGFDITPVDVSLSINNVISPIAFLEFSLGSSLSTGWQFIGIDGLAILPTTGVAVETPFQGVLSKSWLSGKFQFDLAAIMSGDTTWKHLVMMSYHSINYKHFSAANAIQPWISQGGGATYNGFRYEHSSLIGYQMPLVLDMVGILVETGANMFEYSTISTIAKPGWGSDYIDLKLGALFSFKLGEHSSLVLLPQIKQNIRYTDATVRQNYFANRVVNIANPTFWDFERLAISYSYKF